MGSWCVSLSLDLHDLQDLVLPEVLKLVMDTYDNFSILMGTFDVSERAPIRTEQSDLKVTSCKPMSFVKEMAMSIAFGFNFKWT